MIDRAELSGTERHNHAKSQAVFRKCASTEKALILRTKGFGLDQGLEFEVGVGEGLRRTFLAIDDGENHRHLAACFAYDVNGFEGPNRLSW